MASLSVQMQLLIQHITGIHSTGDEREIKTRKNTLCIENFPKFISQEQWKFAAVEIRQALGRGCH